MRVWLDVWTCSASEVFFSCLLLIHKQHRWGIHTSVVSLVFLTLCKQSLICESKDCWRFSQWQGGSRVVGFVWGWAKLVPCIILLAICIGEMGVVYVVKLGILTEGFWLIASKDCSCLWRLWSSFCCCNASLFQFTISDSFSFVAPIVEAPIFNKIIVFYRNHFYHLNTPPCGAGRWTGHYSYFSLHQAHQSTLPCYCNPCQQNLCALGQPRSSRWGIVC